jgi:uncharacterized membrane protein required for colicin V production
MFRSKKAQIGVLGRAGQTAGPGDHAAQICIFFVRFGQTRVNWIYMTIWLLGIVLIAAVAALGYRQGVIRVACSFVGLLIGAALAFPLSRLVRPVIGIVIKNPLLLWALAPVLVFIIFSTIAKLTGFALHRKMDVFYKYKGGELRMALWERVNHRLGLCLGIFNGAAYFVLISFIIYSLSYWTVQLSSPDSDPKTIKILNRLGHDLEATGFVKVASGLSSWPENYFKSADVTGLIYNNPLTEARLSRYPGFLGFAERPEIRDLASDQEFTKLRAEHASAMALFDHPKVQAIVKNHDLLKSFWDTLSPNLDDLQEFLRTLKSPRYDSEKILGRWHFDINSAMGLLRKAKPNMSSIEMQKYKRWMSVAFLKTTFIATPEHTAFMKNIPAISLSAAASAPSTPQNLQGEWKDLDGKYQVIFNNNGKTDELMATVEGERLHMGAGMADLSFVRED